MARSGISRIEQMFESNPPRPRSAPAMPTRTASERYTTCCGDMVAKNFGVCSACHAEYLGRGSGFLRLRNDLDPSDSVDGVMIHKLVDVAARTPIARRPYVSLALDFEFSGGMKILLLTTLLEGNGAFSALN